MSEVSKKVAEMLLSTESIAVYKDKPFVFVSGRISPVYIDCRKLLSFAAEREYIVTALAKKAETDIGLDNIDVVAGGETAGIPYASFVSHLLKKADDLYPETAQRLRRHQTDRGHFGARQASDAGRRSDHGRPEQAAFQYRHPRRRSEDDHCLCVFDYASDRLNQHEGKINLAKNDIELHVLANWDDVLDTGLSKSYFSEQSSRQIIDFLNDPENWGRKMGFV